MYGFRSLPDRSKPLKVCFLLGRVFAVVRFFPLLVSWVVFVLNGRCKPHFTFGQLSECHVFCFQPFALRLFENETDQDCYLKPGDTRVPCRDVEMVGYGPTILESHNLGAWG